VTDEGQAQHVTTELELRRNLEQTFGRMMSSKQIGQLLVYPSAAAFRQALHRGAVKIRMFTLPQRRGRFAVTIDVARWLSAQVGERSSDPSRLEEVGRRRESRRTRAPP